jgi:hypothetical protein
MTRRALEPSHDDGRGHAGTLLASRAASDVRAQMIGAFRAFTDTFAGIRPDDVPAFVVGQVGGALRRDVELQPGTTVR